MNLPDDLPHHAIIFYFSFASDKGGSRLLNPTVFNDKKNMEDPDEEAEETHHNDRRKKKKVKIMTQSGQSEADRRVLRQRQRTLHDDIMSGGAGRDQEGSEEEPSFHRMRRLNNDLWGEVRFTREAVLDSENMDVITANAARQAESIVQVPRYDAVRLAQMLVKKASVRTASGSSYFGWKGFGFQVGVCFNTLPSHVGFLYGPLDSEYQVKERKKPERQKKQSAKEHENEEEERPDDVDQTEKKESDGNELSAVETHIKIIRKTLNKRSKEEFEIAKLRQERYVAELNLQIEDVGEEKKQVIVEEKKREYKKESYKVDAVKNLFNPQSFTQTVENIFHFSFLIKQNMAAIEVRDSQRALEMGLPPGPVIQPLRNHGVSGEDLAAPTQAIVSLNIRDWKDMCKAYEVGESDVPHRGK